LTWAFLDPETFVAKPLDTAAAQVLGIGAAIETAFVVAFDAGSPRHPAD
jgi:hypothetical protein